MSAVRNSIPSRSYRERPQPLSRSRSHPLLEKRKDYKLRAADHKAKQARLKLLREKAAARNPDEFSFKMMSGAARAGNGKKRGIGNTGGAGDDDLDGRVRREVEMGQGLSTETVKLLKTQDAGFLRTVRSRVRRERERLRGMLGGIKAEGGDVEVLGYNHDQVGPRRTVFVDGQQEQQQALMMEDEEEDDATADVTSSKQQRPKGQRRKQSSIRRKYLAKQRLKLEALTKQDNELGKAERELEMQRARMQGDVGGVSKNGVKFKIKERKR